MAGVLRNCRSSYWAPKEVPTPLGGRQRLPMMVHTYCTSQCMVMAMSKVGIGERSEARPSTKRMGESDLPKFALVPAEFSLAVPSSLHKWLLLAIAVDANVARAQKISSLRVRKSRKGTLV